MPQKLNSHVFMAADKSTWQWYTAIVPFYAVGLAWLIHEAALFLLNPKMPKD
jgi:hypothetical protein